MNLRGSYKKDILDYIKINYNNVYNNYIEIYNKKDTSYWQNLSIEIEKYCNSNKIKYINYFYHKELVDKKKAENK